MTRAPWTTPEQRQWLEKQLPGWANSQEDGTAKLYRTKVFEDWYKAFPLGPPTEEELEKAGGDKRKAEQKQQSDSNDVRWLCSMEKLT